MSKRVPKSEFEKKLRLWQAGKKFTAIKAAQFLGVELTTYRHWLYDGITPFDGKCRDCIEKKLAE